MSSYLNQHVLVLNRLWQAVNICTARRALTLLFEGRAQVVLDCADGSFQTYNFSQWHDFSQQEPHPESIHTISFRIRIPRVILLVLFDRLPKKEVKFTRHNIFERARSRKRSRQKPLSPANLLAIGQTCWSALACWF